MEPFCFRYLNTLLKAAYITQNIKKTISKMARGCTADSMIRSRGRLQERFTDGFMLHMAVGSFRPAESGMP